MSKKTLVFGASTNPSRYSYMAINRLVGSGHEVVAYGLRNGQVAGVDIDTKLTDYKGLDTITLYMNPQRQIEFYDYLIGLNPKRIIFNPGTENHVFYNLLNAKDIDFEQACTLVLLSVNQF